MTDHAPFVHRFLEGDGTVGIVAAAARRGGTGGERLFFLMVARNTGNAVSVDVRPMVKGDGKVAAGRLRGIVKINPIGTELYRESGDARQSG